MTHNSGKEGKKKSAYVTKNLDECKITSNKLKANYSPTFHSCLFKLRVLPNFYLFFLFPQVCPFPPYIMILFPRLTYWEAVNSGVKTALFRHPIRVNTTSLYSFKHSVKPSKQTSVGLYNCQWKENCSEEIAVRCEMAPLLPQKPHRSEIGFRKAFNGP